MKWDELYQKIGDQTKRCCDSCKGRVRFHTYLLEKTHSFWSGPKQTIYLRCNSCGSKIELMTSNTY